jgi:hypothetical protein
VMLLLHQQEAALLADEMGHMGQQHQQPATLSNDGDSDGREDEPEAAPSDDDESSSSSSGVARSSSRSPGRKAPGQLERACSPCTCAAAAS